MTERKNLQVFIDEIQWMDNYREMWVEPEKFIWEKNSIFLNVKHPSMLRLEKTTKNGKKMTPTSKTQYLFRGVIIGLYGELGNKEYQTIIVDCGVKLNIPDKKNTLRIGDFIRFEGQLSGEWSGIFHGYQKTTAKITKIENEIDEKTGRRNIILTIRI